MRRLAPLCPNDPFNTALVDVAIFNAVDMVDVCLPHATRNVIHDELCQSDSNKPLG